MNQKLAVSLNQYLSDCAVEYIKLHNLHWNIVGPDFKQVHEYLETLYDGFTDVMDAIAELLKMHNVYPLASLKSYLSVSTIEELESADYRSSAVLTSVVKDLQNLKDQAEQIRADADEGGWYDIVSFMENQLSDYNKTLWFLQSMAK